MAEDQLRTLIDAVRNRLHQELDAQLSAMADTQTRAVAEARQAAEADAEQRWATRLDAVHAESQRRIEAELETARAGAERTLAAETARARAEAEQAAVESSAAARRQVEESFAAERQRLEAELATARAGADRTLAAETARLRAEAEQAVMESTAAGRRQAEESFKAERQRLEAQLEAARGRAAELEAEQQSTALELARQRQRVSELEAERAQEATRAQELPRAAAASEQPSRLLGAFRALDEAQSLTDLLAATVTGAAAEAPRAAMFVAQGAELREWPVAGIRSLDGGPSSAAGAKAGVLGEALRGRRPAATRAGNGAAAPSFASVGTTGAALAVPLVLDGVPVAILYADEGTDGHSDRPWQPSVEMLGRHAAACAASLTAVRTAQALRLMSGAAGAAAAAPDSSQEELQAARRYARLLVSEIKLYNEGAVRVGRERRDLLVRLDAEIGRARRLYEERVAPSVHGRETVFQQELAHTLADGDPSLLGVPGQQQASW